MKKQFTKQQNVILSEIYRRLNYFHGGNLNEPLMYLGYPSDAKIVSEFKIIEPYNRETPRVLNWYKLTPTGKTFFTNYVTKCRLSDETNTKLFNGEYVKTFDYSLVDSR